MTPSLPGGSIEIPEFRNENVNRTVRFRLIEKGRGDKVEAANRVPRGTHSQFQIGIQSLNRTVRLTRFVS